METHDLTHSHDDGEPEVPYLLRVSVPVLVCLNALFLLICSLIVLRAAPLLGHSLPVATVEYYGGILFACNLCWQLIMRYKVEHDEPHSHEHPHDH